MNSAGITQLEECRPCKTDAIGSIPVTGSCRFCGKQTKNPKFCNRSCAASYNNRGITRHGKPSVLLGRCKHCHVGIEGRNAEKYCSLQCQQDYQVDRKIEQWLFGDWDGNVQSGASSIIRRVMLEIWGNKCARCKWGEINPTSGTIPLELEHIDGNHKNNSITNLVILCPNCHSLTPTYKALNRGKGRTYRKKYET